MKRSTALMGTIGVLVVIATAAIAALVTREVTLADNEPAQATAPKKVVKTKSNSDNLPWQERRANPAPAYQTASAQPARKCDDANAIGLVAGGVGGGVLGSQFGKGSGKTAATIGGALGGAYLGGQYIPTRGALCN